MYSSSVCRKLLSQPRRLGNVGGVFSLHSGLAYFLSNDGERAMGVICGIIISERIVIRPRRIWTPLLSTQEQKKADKDSSKKKWYQC